ncbi:MAG: VacJ family lipoprotein [Deltaproteobacteria bacterium]|nr:VacJ family lipoprotein [Deltaproteobacteria bacterium]
MPSIVARAVVIFALILSAGCAPHGPPKPQPVQDPWEGMNRKIFWFNDKADTYFLAPVARGYEYITPKPVENSIRNFFSNLRFPVHFVSELIQFKFSDAAEQAGRFIVNTTIGVVGLFDPATDMGLHGTQDDIGVAFGYHGVPEGPYLVLPFLGPSNVRDAIGRIGNLLLDPLFFASRIGETSDGKDWVLTGLYALDIVDTRASLLEAVKTAKESSLDYYLFAQSAYHQYRQGLIYDGNAPDDEDGLEYSDEPTKEDKEELPAGLP